MLSVGHAGGGRVAIRGIDPTIAYFLHQIPDILARRNGPEARRRLYPDPRPAGDPRNAEWHRLVDGDLRHLFDSAAEIVTRDLAGFVPPADTIEFPSAHLPAWTSALNQARIVLAERHGFEAADMERTDLDAALERDMALLQVQVLGVVLHLLVEHALGEMS